jgi:hypothetical protein
VLNDGSDLLPECTSLDRRDHLPAASFEVRQVCARPPAALSGIGPDRDIHQLDMPMRLDLHLASTETTAIAA